MNLYRVRSNRITYLVESSSRNAALISVITEIVAAQLLLLLPADLAVDDYDEFDASMEQESEDPPDRQESHDARVKPITFDCPY